MNQGLPQGITSAAHQREPFKLRAEVVIVGLGAGGGMVFHDLAIKGVDVLAVEVGSYFRVEEMTCLEEQMMPQIFAEAGARATEDFGINVMQGRGVGGSTLHNTNLCKRLPKEILAYWEEAYGLDGLTGRALDEDFAAVEALLNVHPVPDDQVNRNNALFARGIEKLGYQMGRLSHNRKECKQSGFCELGCPNNGKENVSKVLVPPALKGGGRILADARIDTVLTKNGRAVGVRGVGIDPGTRRETAPFEIMATRVVLSASATASAAIHKRSRIADPHGLAGTNLHLHPGTPVVGFFDEGDEPLVEGWKGVPQAVECTEFLEFGPGAKKRAWLVSGFAHAGAAAGFMPGFGAEHARLMRKFPRVAVVIVMLHDHAAGRVSPGRGEKVHVFYELDQEEWDQMAMGIREAARILLAAGARRALVPMNQPRWFDDPMEVDRLRSTDLGPMRLPLVAVHPMSTLWMGADPRRSVVNPRGEHHHVRDLYVADGSLFPTSIGGPPQIPIYTFGRQVARHIYQGL